MHSCMCVSVHVSNASIGSFKGVWEGILNIHHKGSYISTKSTNLTQNVSVMYTFLHKETLTNGIACPQM